MGSVVPNSMNKSTKNKENGTIDDPQIELDAGALFVLKSRGSWLHCGYHLTTSIVGPVIFSLPFALALLGWVLGVLCIAIAGLVTFYSYNLLSLVLEHHAQLGKRQLRFRDMARDILGPRWGKYFVGPLQFAICYGAVISCSLLGGQSLKFIYLLYDSNGGMRLYQFIIIFGAAILFLAQMPSFHSLRHINLISLVLCLAYSACVAAGSIHIGNSKNAPPKDYSIYGSQENRFFGSINAIAIISTTYASGIIPEIQATLAPPVKGKMFKGLCLCYAVIVSTFFSVAISGYWTFGNQASGIILTNFVGPRWGKYFVGPLQFAICYGAVISCSLLGGQSLKFIYLLYDSNGGMRLYQFIIIFGAAILFLAQMPSFHSLRHINLISLVLCLAYSACVAAGSIHIGNSKNAPPKDYSIYGSQENRFFGSINAIAIISTTYASGIIPEIQATLAPPVKGKMFKGLCLCYAVIVSTFFSVAISGYWTFGNQASGIILTNFVGDNNTPLLPAWFLLMTNIFTLVQLTAICVIYLQPTNELFEKCFANPKKDQFSTRNILPRLIFRSLSVITAITIAAMLPFFGDIMALFGAFGCIPLDFILPMVFYNVTFKPSKQSLIFWINTLIAVVSSILSVVGAVASVRQIVLDAKTYSLFANM
ncbi:hypothetical protein JCGZ_01535 [Jatropha curcas]|uniref:Amino acid transporter transmembrane domain-containing protein n=1 Tax=Jatropha curcas TaxID=180498 RepID=A0A067LK19_JATCU|nr:hypothetical protein JCGZ_01535 [Jatropha curcas]